MLSEIKIFISIIATGIAIFAYIPYLIDMFRGKNRPHLYTWISIVLVTTIVVYIQFIGGAGFGAIPTIIGDVIDVIILIFCFRYGTKDVVFMDKVCLAISVMGVLAYIAFHNFPIISLAIVSAAEVISFIPTYRKTRNDPYSESLTSYYIVMIKLILILFALQSYNLLTASYSVLWIVVYVVFLLSVFYWRTKRKSLKSA
jgi:hypothetical protein